MNEIYWLPVELFENTLYPNYRNIEIISLILKTAYIIGTCLSDFSSEVITFLHAAIKLVYYIR